jgi:FMN phosphatase YigB (HAD superfamily)
MNKKLIIFDCYGTLLTHSDITPYPTFLNSVGLNLKDFYSKIMTTKNINWKDFIDKEKYSDLQFELSYSIFKQNVYTDVQLIKPYLDDLTEKLNSLKENYVVVILSNLSEEYHYPISKYLEDSVDKVFLSFETGLIKPNPASFNNVKEWYKDNFGEIDNNNIIVVDDSSKNIEQVISMGMIGIHVNNGNIDAPNSIKSFFEWIL